ncbi:MAG TPA: acyl-CoA dehydrogenase family protein [Pseudonocardiaceae bacterium]|jgi:alkylation response protein AidB-like acyl-CoA dehydrogenase|nr:acyl-CoA dehydrogenase family protein [Pseudonocardiaceae bacterium]
MDLTLTDDQRLIQTAARELLDSRAAAAGARAVAAEPAGYSTQLWKEMVELGWTGLAFPESHGGVGAGFLELCLVIEELGRARVPSPFVPTVACCGLPILRHGTEAQRAEWLGAIARGRIMSYALGDEVAAERFAQGLALNGSALFVPYADAADQLLVVARHGDESVVALVDTAAPGVVREGLEVVGDPSCRVSFEDVRVPGERVLGGSEVAGSEVAGSAVAEAVTAYGTAAVCAEMVGGAQGVLDMTVEYARQREQFGKPIGAFQAVQHHCADMAIDVLSSRFIAYEAIWRLASEVDATMELSLAKSWVSEAYQRVCALGHQVHGAIGFTAEHDLHYYSRHAMASALAFGDADVHSEQVARNLGI